MYINVYLNILFHLIKCYQISVTIVTNIINLLYFLIHFIFDTNIHIKSDNKMCIHIYEYQW